MYNDLYIGFLGITLWDYFSVKIALDNPAKEILDKSVTESMENDADETILFLESIPSLVI